MINKRDFILRGSCFCEKYNKLQPKYGKTVYHTKYGKTVYYTKYGKTVYYTSIQYTQIVRIALTLLYLNGLCFSFSEYGEDKGLP